MKTMNKTALLNIFIMASKHVSSLNLDHLKIIQASSSSSSSSSNNNNNNNNKTMFTIKLLGYCHRSIAQ
jgi:hypothetical protein